MTTSGQGALDELVHLALELGVFEALEVTGVERERAGIPDELLLRVLAVLLFAEAIGLSAAAGQLLEDTAILLRLGFNIQPVQHGFNERHGAEAAKAETSKPCHPDVLREELGRVNLLCLNWRLLDADASEKGQGAHLVRHMVTEIRAAGGAEAIERLVVDALYADGPLLAWLEHACGIHALVRVPEDRLLFEDLQGLAEGGLYR